MKVSTRRGLPAAHLFGALTAALLFTGTAAFAQATDDLRCLGCHGKPGFQKRMESGQVLDLFVDPSLLRLSSHKERKCVDCHADVAEVPHKERPGRVNCRRCHYQDNQTGAPQTKRYLQFEDSVHGKALKSGSPKAPICQDCHGDHSILPGTDPRSSVAHAQVPHVCGTCHIQVFGKYRESAHGKALAKGVKDAPVCTDCHGEHTIAKPGEGASSVNALNISNTCARCHASVAIMEKYGVEAGQVATYEESFHGIANEFGVKKAANCASCHTAHDILPASDTRSTIHPSNIPTTCGKCHPGANAEFAKGRMHINPKDKSAGLVYWVAFAFKILTIGTLVGLFIHIGMDLFRQIKERREGASGHGHDGEVA